MPAGSSIYLLDGMTALGVVTVNGSGGLVSSYFNVVAGDKVVGRQPATGNRRYYHTDLVGSTRAVVEGATVVESYDFDPWGLLMPGRTLAGPTKEGFTGKEQDAESGLDYFGARYYMAALGRWTAVDPLAEKHPEWSPYNYVLGNPLALLDPDGRQVAANMSTFTNSVYGQHHRYLSNMSPAQQRAAMQHGVTLPDGSWQFSQMLEQVPLAVGLEAQLPVLPGLATNFSVDITTRGVEPDAALSTGSGFGAAYTFGVKDPSPRKPGEVTGSVLVAAGVGAQFDYAIGNDGARLTGFRLAVGFGVSAQKVELRPSVNIPDIGARNPPVTPIVPDQTRVSSSKAPANCSAIPIEGLQC